MEQPPESGTFGRVELRRLRVDDAAALHAVVEGAREHLVPWMPWAAEQDLAGTTAYLAASEEGWRSGEAYGYGILCDGELAGSCGLMRRIGPGGLDIGYWLHPAWTGRGLATTSVEALVRWAFELAGIDRVEIHHDAANTASAAVPRRLGFTEAGREPVRGGPTAPGETGIDVTWRLLADREGRGDRG
ncbi:GNAT family N-acetyltransferase [Streptomyces daqingensis]|uniref:GNAT family N-acetyltransferase n=1 Tax=Streptomyces daqingensis TaxID=1472640 RepID=UPI001666369C|nr:GNAT family N-acetyltransferase [Streptomyces daqingensis]